MVTWTDQELYHLRVGAKMLRAVVATSEMSKIICSI